MITTIILWIIVGLLVLLDSFQEPPRKELCSYCGKYVTDWVDPDWARGRVCRKCETKFEPNR